jgi:uncharacterized membrane protein
LARRGRVDSIDLLRGLVMAAMLLDHARDFVHHDVNVFDPLDLERTSVALYFTRWITHFCAPTFVLLAGTGAYLYGRRCASKGELARFLATRGLFLVGVELVLLRPLIFFNLDLRFLAFLQVIWAIGVSMVVLALLLHFSTRTIAAIGAALIALHNAFDGVRVTAWGGPGTPIPNALEALWIVLHQGGAIPLGANAPVIGVAYPLVPWIGVMAAGYGLGALYELDTARRTRLLAALGAGCVLLFVALRASNLYGEPSPWSRQASATFTLLSFLDTTKYPPSLCYLAMTLGPALLALAALERFGVPSFARPLVVLGRVPFFFYVLQWPLLHLIAMLFGLIDGQPIAWQTALPWDRPAPFPDELGFSLRVVYLAWLVALLVLYPLSAWFAGVKRRKRARWLSFV